jgi:hypothetical protein
MRRGLPLVVLAVLLVSCAPVPRSWRYPPRIFRSSTPRPTPAQKLRPSPHAVPAAALVERALHQRGLRFGTDGTVGALHGYLAENGHPVRPGQARAGDVVFFDLTGQGPDHVGLVERADPDGRITFRELRDGEVKTSYVFAPSPSARRDERGRILNSFLRPKRPEDPPYLRYFAGELLVGVLRVQQR